MTNSMWTPQKLYLYYIFLDMHVNKTLTYFCYSGGNIFSKNNE